MRSVVKSRPLRQLLEAVELEGVLVQADAPGAPFPEHLPDALLQRPIDPCNHRTRKQGGKELSYAPLFAACCTVQRVTRGRSAPCRPSVTLSL